MGLVRFILAMSVVYAHVDPPLNLFRGVGGATAVESFFVISGFLISKVLVLNKYETKRDFYLSRYLRIFPSYLIAVGFSVLFLLGTKFLGHSQDFVFSFYTFIPNLLIFFQDLVFLFDASLDSNFSNSILVGVSWTLALELYFYLIAPWLHRFQTKHLLILSLLFLALKATLFTTIGLSSFYSYRFAPLEFGFFLLGFAIARIKIGLTISMISFAFVITTPFILEIYKFGNQLDTHAWYSILYPCLVSLSLFFATNIDNRNRAIKYLGSLSFPIYMYHSVISMYVISAVSFSGKSIDPRITSCVIVLMTLIASTLSLEYVESYFDKIRYRRINNNSEFNN